MNKDNWQSLIPLMVLMLLCLYVIYRVFPNP
jgi:hypothetical protein